MVCRKRPRDKLSKTPRSLAPTTRKRFCNEWVFLAVVVTLSINVALRLWISSRSLRLGVDVPAINEGGDPAPISVATEAEHDNLQPFRSQGDVGAQGQTVSWRERIQRKQKRATASKSSARPKNATLANPCGLQNIDTVTECGGHGLPVTPYTAPTECWPRVVLLPSFPTSGNGLVHHTFENLTGLVAFAVPESRGEMGFDLTSENRKAFSLYYANRYVCPAENATAPTLAVAHSGRVALTKTHQRGQKEAFASAITRFTSTQAQKDGHIGGAVSAVVRLARNPGDHVLRNLFRWKFKSCHDDDCFFQQAPAVCGSAQLYVRDWSKFHKFWDSYDPTVPQTILNYELFSRPETAPNVFRHLLNFVGEKENEPGTLKSKVRAIVSEPSYQQGSLMARVCGVKAARYVHSQTEEHSKRLGYTFDGNTGFWSLDETTSS